MPLTSAELNGPAVPPGRRRQRRRRSFSYTVNDGNGGSDSQTVTLNITPVNDAPVNTVPSAQTMSEDGTLTFSSRQRQRHHHRRRRRRQQQRPGHAHRHQRRADPGRHGRPHGQRQRHGRRVTVTGSQANINTALNGLVFAPTGNFNGSANLTVTTNDQGNTGSGGALTDVDSVAITVNPVNDAPINTVPSAQTMSEDGTLTFSAANGNAIAVADVDAGSSQRPGHAGRQQRRADPRRHRRPDGQRQRHRHGDGHRQPGQYQRCPQRPGVRADRQLQRLGQPHGHHQRPGQHRLRRCPQRYRLRRHHGHPRQRRALRRRRQDRDRGRRLSATAPSDYPRRRMSTATHSPSP